MLPSDQVLQQLSGESAARPVTCEYTSCHPVCVLKHPSRAAVRPVCTAIHLLARLAQHQPYPVQDESPPPLDDIALLSHSAAQRRHEVVRVN
jgi:hypothetical protein